MSIADSQGGPVGLVGLVLVVGAGSGAGWSRGGGGDIGVFVLFYCYCYVRRKGGGRELGMMWCGVGKGEYIYTAGEVEVSVREWDFWWCWI